MEIPSSYPALFKPSSRHKCAKRELGAAFTFTPAHFPQKGVWLIHQRENCTMKGRTLCFCSWCTLHPVHKKPVNFYSLKLKLLILAKSRYSSERGGTRNMVKWMRPWKEKAWSRVCVYAYTQGRAADVFVLVAVRYSVEASDTTLAIHSNTNALGRQVLSIKDKITYRFPSVSWNRPWKWNKKQTQNKTQAMWIWSLDAWPGIKHTWGYLLILKQVEIILMWELWQYIAIVSDGF